MLEIIPELTDPATGEKVKVLYGQDKSGSAKLESSCWYKDEPFYTGINKDGTPIPNAHPCLKWRLTSKSTVAGVRNHFIWRQSRKFYKLY